MTRQEARIVMLTLHNEDIQRLFSCHCDFSNPLHDTAQGFCYHFGVGGGQTFTNNASADHLIITFLPLLGFKMLRIETS